MTKRKLSDKGGRCLEHVEGFRAKRYPDAGGWSIGYGTYLDTPEEKKRYWDATITREHGRELLWQDVGVREAMLRRYTWVPLNQHQWDALVLFAYNVKPAQFLKSTLLKKLNAGDYDGAGREFERWVYSQGNVHPGLEARRKLERAIFDGQTDVEHYA